jgi:formylmethanofuran dehydrogenase subunit B
LPWTALEQLALRLRDTRHVAFLYDAGLAGGRDGSVSVRALQALVRDLHALEEPVHAVTAHLRHEGNAAGAEAVLAWQTGYSGAVSFMRGFPRANADEFAAAGLLIGGDVDAALVVGSDPLEHLPEAAAQRLRAIPIVSVDERETTTAGAAQVAFVTPAAGLYATGTAHRLDDVPLPLRAPLKPSRPARQDQLLHDHRALIADHASSRQTLLAGEA